MIAQKDITGIVLIGGKSSRMGTDKGFIKFNNATFVEHSINALLPLVDEIILVGNHQQYDALGYKRVPDVIVDAGPVSGIYSGLKESKTVYNFVLSCDIPLIKTAILKKLLIKDIPEVVQLESNGRKMPLIALYKKSSIVKFEQALQNKVFRLQEVLKTCEATTVVLKESDCIFTTNVNTQNELKEIKDANRN